MATTVDSVIVELSAKVDRYNRDVNTAAVNFDRRMGTIEKSSKRMSGAVSSGFNLAKGAAAGFVASLGVDAVTRAIGAGLDYASSLGEVAQQLGVTTDALQFYRFVATQTGIEQGEIDTALGKLTKTIGEAAKGNKSAAKAFEDLGINIRDANGQVKNAETLLPEIADGIKNLSSEAERGAAATDLFGRAGQKLLPAISGGAAGINELAAAYAKLGIALSPEQIKKADDAADTLSKVKTVLEARIAGVVADNSLEIIEYANSLAELANDAIKTLKAYKSFTDELNRPIPYKNQNVLQKIASDLNAIQNYGTEVRRFFDGKDLQNINQATFSVGGSNAASGRGPRLPATPRGPTRQNLPGLTPMRGAGGAFGVAGVAGLGAIDLGAILEMAAAFERAETKARQLQATLAKLPKEARAYLDELRAEQNLNDLREEGNEEIAQLIERQLRIRQQFPELSEKDVAALQTAAIALEQQAMFAERRRDAEREIADYLSDSLSRNDNGLERLSTPGLEALDEYERRGEEANRFLADNFETLFTDGFDGLWRNFKSEGIRAVAQILANLVQGQNAFAGFGGGGGGGGIFGSILSIGASLFGPGRASGGNVQGGKLYRVNETGIEGFRPAQSGTIVPMGQMPRAAASMAGNGMATVRIELAGDIDARIESVSGPVAVQVMRAAAPMIIEGSVAETFRRGGRPKL